MLVVSCNFPKALLDSSSWNTSEQFYQSCILANTLSGLSLFVAYPQSIMRNNFEAKE